MVVILRNSLVSMQRPERRFLILIAFIYNLYRYNVHIIKLSFLFYNSNQYIDYTSIFCICIQCVNRLSVDTRKIVRGHHTRRTSAFVRACAAFCFITIPSLTLVHTRLQLYLLSGQVALLNQCLGQGVSRINLSNI